MLVGRRRELERLAGAMGGRGAFVLGEAGIGKTTVLRSAGAASQRPVLYGECLAGLSWYTYLPICRAIGREPPPGDAAHVAHWVTAQVGDGLLIVDDLQWADSETLALLDYVVGRIGLLVAVRKGDPATDAAVGACRSVGLEQVALGPIGRPDARQIVRRARPDLAAKTIERIVDEASGNPLLLEELAHGNGLRTLRLGLRARLNRCSPSARRTMAVLGALGRPATVELAGPGVAELREAGLLAAGPDAAPRHTLLGEIALADIQERERRRIHAELAARIADPGEAARHHLAAGNRVAAHRAALVAARATGRPGDRARHLAVAATTAPDAWAGRNALLIEAADALIQVRSFSNAQSLLGRVASTRRVERARFHLLVARCRAKQTLDDEWEAEVRQGLELVEGTGAAVETELLIELVERPVWACDADEAVRRARIALLAAERSGTALGRAHAKLAQALYLEEPERCRPHLATARELAVRDRDGDTEMLVGYLGLMVDDLLTQSLGSGVPYEERIETLAQRAEELGLGCWAIDGRYMHASYRYAWDGPSPEVADLYSDVLRGFPPFTSRDQAVPELAQLLADLGRDADARAFMAQAPKAASGWGAAVEVLVEAEMHWLAGRAEAAAETAAGLAAKEGLFGAEELARCIRALALLDLGEPVPAPCTRPHRIHHFAGPLEHGVHALSTGDAPYAELLFAEAARLSERWSARDTLRARWLMGEAARIGGDPDRAACGLQALAGELSARSMLPLLRRVERSLRRTGNRASTRRSPRENGLTAREWDVLELVGGGLSSREVAARLGVSRTTVESHVRSARTKLGARTRLEAAVVARNRAATTDRL